MLNFFIGFAFFEAGAFFGFFVAALLNAAHAGQENANFSKKPPCFFFSLFFALILLSCFTKAKFSLSPSFFLSSSSLLSAAT